MNEQQIISDSVLNKIKKFLALSGSNNQNEATLALVHAQKLAEEYNVNLKLINIYDKTKKSATIEKKDNIFLGNRKSICQHLITNLLQSHFNVKCLYSGSRYSGMKLILIGTKENIEFAEYINFYLNSTFMRLWQNYYKSSKCQLHQRGSYLSGLSSGLSEKLTNEQKNVESEKLNTQTEDIKNQYALMVVSEKDRLQKAVKEFYPKLGTYHGSNSNHGWYSNVVNDGHRDGQNISVRRGINNNSSQNQINY